jgi:hypothetical protein
MGSFISPETQLAMNFAMQLAVASAYRKHPVLRKIHFYQS